MLVASMLLAAIVVGVFVVLLLALSALHNANRHGARSKEVTASALKLDRLVLGVETSLRGTYDRPGHTRRLKPFREARQELMNHLGRFEKAAALEPIQRKPAQNLTSAIRGYVLDYADLVVNFQSRGASRASESEGAARVAVIRGRLQRFLTEENALSAKRERSADAKARRAIELGVMGLTGSAILILLFGIYLARVIARPVSEAAEGAGRLAAGDLSIRLSQKGPGEVGELTRSFNEMAERLEVTRDELEDQNAQLRESERLKSDLVNTVSHELRTPLSGVMGFTKLLLTREFDPETRRHYLGIVDAQARRLSDLLDDFLDVRRIEEGRFERAQELVDMATLLREEAVLYNQQSPKHDVAVEIDHAPLAVIGNPDRLRQVIGNLISNAIKYSPQGGVVEVSADQENGSVRVEVRDEGMGIPLSQQPQIFTKFFRGDAPASGITGTGLGLAVSRDIVESHGGRIGFTSAEGKGTTFFVELPGANGVKDRQGHDEDQS
jgi:signal transduction histidine kinase